MMKIHDLTLNEDLERSEMAEVIGGRKNLRPYYTTAAYYGPYVQGGSSFGRGSNMDDGSTGEDGDYTEDYANLILQLQSGTF